MSQGGTNVYWQHSCDAGKNLINRRKNQTLGHKFAKTLSETQSHHQEPIVGHVGGFNSNGSASPTHQLPMKYFSSKPHKVASLFFFSLR